MLHGVAVIIKTSKHVRRITPDVRADVPTRCRCLSNANGVIVPKLVGTRARLFSRNGPLGPGLTAPGNRHVITAFTRSPLNGPCVTTAMGRGTAALLRSNIAAVHALNSIKCRIIALHSRVSTNRVLKPHVLTSKPLVTVPRNRNTPLVTLADNAPRRTHATITRGLGTNIGTVGVTTANNMASTRRVNRTNDPRVDIRRVQTVYSRTRRCNIVINTRTRDPRNIQHSLLTNISAVRRNDILSSRLVNVFQRGPGTLHKCSTLVPALSTNLPLALLKRSIANVASVRLRGSGGIIKNVISNTHRTRRTKLVVNINASANVAFIPRCTA